VTSADPPEPSPVDAAADEAARRRRLAEVFGDPLPETTSDERDDDGGAEKSARDEWYRDQVPPHHGGD
jgi:hypothetical protein